MINVGRWGCGGVGVWRCGGAEYDEAYEVLPVCSTEVAPWHVGPADHKWYRDWAVAHPLLETLAGLGLRYPTPDPDLAAERERLAQEG